MNYSMLCQMLLPDPVREEVKRIDQTYRHRDWERYWRLLFSPKQWQHGFEELSRAFGEDPKGFQMLTCELHCALTAYRQYRQKGIPEKIFWDTMGFIPRFLTWQKEHYGDYSFPWGWWFPRQLSLHEFRLGELEYERVHTEEGPVVSLHIPSGARLEPALLQTSLRQMQDLFLQYYPNFFQAPILCDSWMLSPALKELLPEDSRILWFQSCFEVQSVDWDSDGVLDWVFPGPRVPYEQLPEKTALQRAMKQYLLEGKKVGWARGMLKGF